MQQMNIIKAIVTWENGNYACGWGFPGFGAVFCTATSLESVKNEFEQSLSMQIHDMITDGEEIPQWLADKDFRIEYQLEVSALLREAAQYVSFAAISRATGINQKLLSSYANSDKKPRESQRARIISGINRIGQQLCAVR